MTQTESAPRLAKEFTLLPAVEAGKVASMIGS